MSQIWSAVTQLKGQIKVDPNRVTIENRVFRLFSKLTVVVLIVSSALVTMQQLVGEHIKCLVPPKEDIRPQALHQYCFIMSTYTVPKYYTNNNNNLTVGVDIPHPGVGPYDLVDDDNTAKYHNYYQWVPFALFFQAIFFMAPHFLWKAIEDKLMNKYCNLELADNLKFNTKIKLQCKNEESEKLKNSKIRGAAQYFYAYIGYNHYYSYGYFICEALNFIVVVLNIYLVDTFLDNQFSNYGPSVVNFLSKDPETRNDPLSIVFPKVTKCDFRKFGHSGSIVRYDVMCVLALNIINEKIYTFLWFWFIILAIVGGLQLVYRLILMFIPGVRNKLLSKIGRDYHDKSAIDQVTSELDYCDYFILKQISANINQIRFVEFCRSLSVVMREKTNTIKMHHKIRDLEFKNDKEKELLEKTNKSNESDDEDKTLIPFNTSKLRTD